MIESLACSPLAVDFEFTDMGLLDRRRHPRRDLRDLHARPAAQRRLHRRAQLRPGRLHGDRRLLVRSSSRSTSGCSFWLALPLSARRHDHRSALIIGMPSLRLRADYFAIATIAFSPRSIRDIAQNARDLTGGNQGTIDSSSQRQRLLHGHWYDVSDWILADMLDRSGSRTPCSPLLFLVVGGGAGPARVRPQPPASARPGAGSCGRSARTRTRRARSARTSSPTSSSRSRSPPCSARSRAGSSRSTSNFGQSQDVVRAAVHVPRLSRC